MRRPMDWRCLRHTRGEGQDQELRVDSLIGVWQVEFAATSINSGRRRPDGQTAWELRHGSPFKRDLVILL